MKIIVYGSVAFDSIKDYPGFFKDAILPDNIHSLNVSFQVESVSQKRGGCGGNIAYNLSLLGEKPKLLSSVGTDAMDYLWYLKDRGVDISSVTIHEEERTSTADIITDRSNNQITAFYIGASAANVEYSLHSESNPEELLLMFPPANNIDEAMRLIREAKELGIRYIFDSGQTTVDFSKEQLREVIEGAYMLTTNDYEFALIKKITELSEEEIRKQVPVLVKTMGSEGSMIWTEDEEYHIPVCEAFELVDPTGAGDAYRAGLLKGIANGTTVEEAGYIASAAANYTIAHNGTQEHSYTMAEFREVFEKHFGKSCPI